MRWSFHQFFTEQEIDSRNQELRDTIKLLPKSHQCLLRGYKFEFQDGNTLKNDEDHIGSNNLEKKIIKVATPFWYSRDFALLHEIGHLIWDHYMTNNKDLIDQWRKITNATKNKVNQNTEELWCQTYACLFAKNKVPKHDHPEWEKFLRKILS